jgi:hypothetical protein
MSAICFGIYAYLSNKIILLRRQNVLLVNQNNELRAKVKMLIQVQKTSTSSIVKVVDANYSNAN